MAMSIDQALQYPGELVAVWDEAGGGGRLLICAVADGRLGVLATAELPAAERAERTALLRARGVRIGATERRGPYYWSRDGGFTVWSLLETVVDSRDDRLWVAGRGELERAEAALVVSFLGKSLGHRGVLVVTGDGRELVIAEAAIRPPTSTRPTGARTRSPTPPGARAWAGAGGVARRAAPRRPAVTATQCPRRERVASMPQRRAARLAAQRPRASSRSAIVAPAAAAHAQGAQRSQGRGART
ncbi:MAG: hypothetical protein HS111_20345 [Kofleriaceae bacterium]|nr:hypothetical protein [Kofleriaceae bacterium]